MSLPLHHYQDQHHQLSPIHHLESFAVVVVVVVRHLDKRSNPLLNNLNPSCHHRHLVGGTSLDVVVVVDVVEYQRLCCCRHHHRHRMEPIAAADGRTLTMNYYSMNESVFEGWSETRIRGEL